MPPKTSSNTHHTDFCSFKDIGFDLDQTKIAGTVEIAICLDDLTREFDEYKGLPLVEWGAGLRTLSDY